MEWFLFGAAILLIGGKLLPRWIPAHCRYLSPRERRAMCLAVQAFQEEHPDSCLDCAGSWVYLADTNKCVVFVQHVTRLHPPSFAGYVVWHERAQVDRIGGWQFHWGIVPRHAVEEYEASRATNRPEGPQRTKR